jgi:O-antigen/teichoic acid export membrane protein
MSPDTSPRAHTGHSALRTPAALLARARSDSLTRNSAYIMATTIVNSALGAAFWLVAARTFSTQAVGLGAAVIAAMTLAATLSTLGTGPTLIQVLPTRRAGRDWSQTFNACAAAALGSAVIAGGVVLIVLPLLSPRFLIVREAGYRVVLGCGVLFWAAATIVDYAFIAERSAGRMLARNATAAVLKLAMMLCLVALGARSSLGIVSAATISTAGALGLAAAVLLPGLQRGYRPQMKGVVGEARRLLSPFVGHYFITVGGILPMYALPLLVTAQLSATANAYFYTTWMVCNVLFMVSPAVAGALFAEGSHAGDSLRQKARSSAFLIAALLALPMVLLLLGGRFILGLFGPSYANHSYMLLVLLAASAVPDAITNVYTSVLRVERRFSAATALNIGMGLGALLLAWWLLPLVGIAGAGVAWLAAQVAGSAAVAVDLRVRRGRRDLRTEVAPGLRSSTPDPPVL